MLIMVGMLSIVIGYLLEKRFYYISHLLNTKFGKSYLGSNKAILFTELLFLMIIASLIGFIEINVTQFDMISGFVGGQLILILLVANSLRND